MAPRGVGPLHVRQAFTSRNPLVVLDDVDDEALPQVLRSTPREAANIDLSTADIVILLDASA